MGRVTLMMGGERRRQWSIEERARILAEIAEPGAVVADVARRADVCTSLVYKWRREALRQDRPAASGFAPVVIEPAPAIAASPTAAEPKDAAAIIVEVNNARVRIGAGASSALIAATLKALRT